MKTLRFAKHFRSGSFEIPHSVSDMLSEDDVVNGICRHLSCNWGEIGEEEWRANNYALLRGGPLRSRHLTREGTPFWIITNAARSLSRFQLSGEQ